MHTAKLILEPNKVRHDSTNIKKATNKMCSFLENRKSTFWHRIKRFSATWNYVNSNNHSNFFLSVFLQKGKITEFISGDVIYSFFFWFNILPEVVFVLLFHRTPLIVRYWNSKAKAESVDRYNYSIPTKSWQKIPRKNERRW